jgi:hypothetical protein
MDDQARKDALADAETLRLFLDGGPKCPGVPWFSVAGIVADNVWIAQWQGNRAGTLPPPLETADQAAACARIAAEAAFRACPGLRERA